MKKIFVFNLGCPRNLVDGEVIAGSLIRSGFAITDDAEEAVGAVVNTCGFIKEAKEESIDHILSIAELKKTGKLEKLIVAGCLSQRYPKELLKEIPEIDAVFGTSGIPDIPGVLKKMFGETDTGFVQKGVSLPAYLYDHNSPREITQPGYSIYVKIQEGCSNKCSYCVIPELKGERRSREISSIVEEIRDLRSQYNVRELVLVGQDTTSFGIDRSGKTELPELLKVVAETMNDGWVRLLYTHPAHLTVEVMRTMAAFPNICRYVDLPIQHINDDVLKKMNRKVTKKEIIGLIEAIRAAIPGVAIRTSVITGFPGETEEQFEELLDFLGQIQFDRLGTFLYSREEGTIAAGFPEQISDNVKSERFDRIMRLQQEISISKNESLIGTKMKVLIEEPGDDGKHFVGRSEMDAPEVDGTVFVKPGTTVISPGEFVAVRITGAMEYDLEGEVYEPSQ